MATIGRPGNPRPPVREDVRVRRALRNLSSAQSALGSTSSGPYSSLPPPGSLGSVFYPTDGYGPLFDTGSAWTYFYEGRQASIVDRTQYTSVNLNGGSVTGQGTATLMQNVADGVSLFIKPIPAPGSPWFFQAKVLAGMSGTAGLSVAGICVSDGTKFMHVSYQQTTPGQASIVVGEKWSDTSTFVGLIVDAVSGSNLNFLQSALLTTPHWLMIDTLDGKLNFRAGSDSLNYVTLAQTTKGAFLSELKYGFLIRTGSSAKIFSTIPAVYEG